MNIDELKAELDRIALIKDSEGASGKENSAITNAAIQLISHADLSNEIVKSFTVSQAETLSYCMFATSKITHEFGHWFEYIATGKKIRNIKNN